LFERNLAKVEVTLLVQEKANLVCRSKLKPLT
jgi:hypothetical protein